MTYRRIFSVVPQSSMLHHRRLRVLLSSTYRNQHDLLRRLGRPDEARAAYRRAHELAPTGAERRFLATG